ncbi:MAG: GNAT family N-acetyltransferase [Chloroflexota bacterium]
MTDPHPDTEPTPGAAGRAGTGRTFLLTERLRLRQFTADDVDHLVALDADPEVMFFITGGAPTPRVEIEHEVLPAFLRYHERGPDLGFWAIERRADGAFLGWVHYRPDHGDPPDEPELGYRLVRAAWGLGYATEASRAVVDHGFTALPVRRVVARTMAVNTASRRVMEKVGMRLVRTFHADWPVRIPGDEHGDVEYAVTHEEWLAARAIM